MRFLWTCFIVGWLSAPLAAQSKPDRRAGYDLPTGKIITPTAADGATLIELNPGLDYAPHVRAGQPGALAVSPDGKLLAVVTNGFNMFYGPAPSYTPASTSEFLFVFDISGSRPKQKQVFAIDYSFEGLIWSRGGDRLFVSGGTADSVLVFKRVADALQKEKTISLGHKGWVGSCPDPSLFAVCKPQVGQLALDPSGRFILAVNFQNDSVSLIDTERGSVTERDLRPGKIDPSRSGTPGGSFPRGVVWSGSNKAYVSSQRDREIIELSIHGPVVRVLKRIPTAGAPTALIGNRTGSRVYIALESTSEVAVLDTHTDELIDVVDVAAPKSVFDNLHHLAGASPNAFALADDGKTLYVSNGGENAIAIVSLSAKDRGETKQSSQAAVGKGSGSTDAKSAVAGLIPTGWFPTAVGISKDGHTLYVANSKSPTGPVVPRCGQVNSEGQLCLPAPYTPGKSSGAGEGYDLFVRENQSINQQEKGSVLSLPLPLDPALARLTAIVAHNNHFDDNGSAADASLFAFLQSHIKHVIYIVKANESYDSILGDLSPGNGDPKLAWYPRKLTPNQHSLSREFITVDNFLVSGGIGWSGLEWTLSAISSDLTERLEPMGMAGRAVARGSGNNRMMDMGLPTSEERHAESSYSPLDPDILPGTRDVFTLDGPDRSEGQGYLWDTVLKAGKTVRNYGSYPADVSDGKPDLVRNPFSAGVKVFFESKPRLRPYSDPYFHYQWDFRFPDFWRVEEWKREYKEYAAQGQAPNLTLMWICQDVGEYAQPSVDGGLSPDSHMADNDYALGEVVETVANGPFANDTLIISVEDSSRNGADHVDGHRSPLFVAGPYVKRHAVVSTRYTTVNVLKTIEKILGAEPLNINDNFATPMSDLFDRTATTWSYKAVIPDALRTTRLPLPPAATASQK